MDGENNGKPYYKNGWFEGTIILGNTHVVATQIYFEKISPLPILPGEMESNLTFIFFRWVGKNQQLARM